MPRMDKEKRDATLSRQTALQNELEQSSDIGSSGCVKKNEEILNVLNTIEEEVTEKKVKWEDENLKTLLLWNHHLKGSTVLRSREFPECIYYCT